MEDAVIVTAIRISTHALREEGDLSGPASNMPQSPYFYPRPPRGGRHGAAGSWQQSMTKHFYPRPPRGGRHRQSPAFPP